MNKSNNFQPKYWLQFLAINAVALMSLEAANTGIIIADFDEDDFGNWTASGEAFGEGPVHSEDPGKHEIKGFEGKGYASSKPGGYANEGELTSPPFTIEKDYINFLLGGGTEAGHIHVDLLMAGYAVKSAVPAVNHELIWTSWDVAAMKGQTVQIQIVDDRSGHEEGYLFVDSVHQSDIPRAAPQATQTKEREILSAFALNPDPSKLPILGIWKREEQLLVSAEFPDPPGFTCDAWCYENGGIEFLGGGVRKGGIVEMEHRMTKSPHTFRFLTEVIPTPGAIEFVVRAVAGEEAGENLPDHLPRPNICFQLERAPRFKSGTIAYDDYPEFVKRCFIFTDKGRTFLLDADRNLIPCRPESDKENNPPWVQMYAGVWEQPPEPAPNWWAAYSSDRFTIPLIGTVSRDDVYLVAIGEDTADGMCQAWHDCLHTMAKWQPEGAPVSEQTWRMKVYVMENDPDALLEKVRIDFPGIEDRAKNPVSLKD